MAESAVAAHRSVPTRKVIIPAALPGRVLAVRFTENADSRVVFQLSFARPDPLPGPTQTRKPAYGRGTPERLYDRKKFGNLDVRTGSLSQFPGQSRHGVCSAGNIGQAAQQPETVRANCTFESKARNNASGGPEGFLRRKFPKGAVNAEAAAKMSKNRLPLK